MDTSRRIDALATLARGIIKRSPTARNLADKLIAQAATLVAPPLSVRAQYNGARRDRRGWVTSAGNANAEIAPAISQLRQNSRDLIRNTPYGRRMKASLVTNMVGTGITPRVSTGDRDLNKRIETLFSQWSKQCYGFNRQNFYGLQRIAVGGFVESGDVFARFRPRRSDMGLSVPFQIQLIEGDYLDSSRNEESAARSVVQGVTFNQIGCRTGYYLFKNNPSINNSQGSSSFVPYEDLAHIYDEDRPGQVRGVPWLHAVIQSLHDFDGYNDAEQFRKRIESSIAAFVYGDDPTDAAWKLNEDRKADGLGPAVLDSDGNLIETIEPGLIHHMPPGKEVKFNTPGSVGDYAAYADGQEHRIATGVLLPYELLTGNLSKVNYSSIRAGLLEFHRGIRMTQHLTIIPQFCEPIWDTFVKYAQANNVWPTRDQTPVPVTWFPPGWDEVDPVKAATADLLNMRAGIKSLKQVITERGGDPSDVIEDMAETLAALNDKGLILDSIPAQTQKTGALQAAVDLIENDDENGDKRADEKEGTDAAED